MNWPMAIERNRDALLRIVAALFAMAGLSDDDTVATLPRHLHNHILRILRSAESAVRRLIVIAAQDLVVVVVKPQKQATTTSTSKPHHSVILGLDPRTHSGEFAKPSIGKNAAGPSNGGDKIRLHGVGPRVKPEDDARCETTRPIANTIPALPLLDPRKRFDVRPPRRRAKSFPRITFIGLTEPTPIPEGWNPSPDDPVDATCLRRRLAGLKRALDDLPGQAKRLARWRAKRDLGLNRSKYFSPMRPGWPPGHRNRQFHAVDDILTECHALALALERADTS